MKFDKCDQKSVKKDNILTDIVFNYFLPAAIDSFGWLSFLIENRIFLDKSTSYQLSTASVPKSSFEPPIR